MQLSPAEYVIHMFGGVRATARALNKTPSAISKWHHKYDGMIPSKNLPNILLKAQEMELDIKPEDLVIGRNLTRSEFTD